MSSVSSLSSVFVPGVSSDLDLPSYRSRLAVLFEFQPIACLPPIEALPAPGSTEELKLLYALCLESSGYSKEVRRAIILMKRDHEMIVVIALSVFRCPDDLDFAVSGLMYLIGRMIAMFFAWRTTWFIEGNFASLWEFIEHFKQRALETLANGSDLEKQWLDIFVRVFVDLPELWGQDPCSTRSPASAGPSDFTQDMNSPDTYMSDASSFHPAQAMPPSMLAIQGPFDINRSDANLADLSALHIGAGGSSRPSQSIANPLSAAYRAGFASSQSLPAPSGSNPFTPSGFSHPTSYPTLSNPAQVGYEWSPDSSHSRPHPSLPNSTSGVFFHGNIGSSHSLPTLPSEITTQNTYTGGSDQGWPGINPAPPRHHGHVSGLGPVQHRSSRRGPVPSVPTTAVQNIPANTNTTLGTSHETPSTLVATSGVTTSHDTSNRHFASSEGEPEASWISNAIALENAKAATLASRTSLLRLRGTRISKYTHLFLTNIRFFYDGLHRVLCSDYLRIPMQWDYRVAVLKVPEHIGELMARWYVGWKEDIDT